MDAFGLPSHLRSRQDSRHYQKASGTSCRKGNQAGLRQSQQPESRKTQKLQPRVRRRQGPRRVTHLRRVSETFLEQEIAVWEPQQHAILQGRGPEEEVVIDEVGDDDISVRFLGSDCVFTVSPDRLRQV